MQLAQIFNKINYSGHIFYVPVVFLFSVFFLKKSVIKLSPVMRYRREFSSKALHHVYVRCADKGVIFYTLEDRIVYYTLAATSSRRWNVRVDSAALMFTHVHEGMEADSEANLTACIRGQNSAYARVFNNRYQRSGQLFDRPVGHSQKNSSKEKRTTTIYIYNNHVEKGLCRKAEDERWSLLAYAITDHPFSEAIDRKGCSHALSKGVRLIDRRVRHNTPLRYADLDRILPFLSKLETEQFVDYVISRFALIDFSKTIKSFGSIEDMMTAVNSTTGSEYDIKEDFYRQTDTGYVNLVKYASQGGFIRRIFEMSSDEKISRIMEARYIPDVSDAHLRRFFHYDFKVKKAHQRTV